MNRLKRLGELIKIDFDISTLDGVLRLQKDVIHLALERRLGPADARSLNEAIRSLLSHASIRVGG